MILWVMPDSGARTKADYQKLVERFTALLTFEF